LPPYRRLSLPSTHHCCRLRRLPPITSPSTLFHSVLASDDKERLRALVSALGREVRSGLAAANADGYARAARLVADLLELRVIEHGFVAQLVEHEVAHQLIDDLMRNISKNH